MNSNANTADIRISYAGFAATDAKVQPISEKGDAAFAELYGTAAASCTIYKSAVGGYAEQLASLGLRVQMIDTSL